MKILTVTSGKGGVGKSTITLNIARQLSLGGKRTLLVDFDIHNKGVSGLFLPKIQKTSSSVTTLVSESSKFTHGNSLESVAELQFIQITHDANLFLLPASRAQEMIDWSDFHGAENAEIVQFFRTLLTNVAAHFNFDAVVIDCYGGIDSLTVAAAGIADDTIIVNEPDLITFSGTLQLYMYLRKQYSGAERQPRLHFVINRVTYRHSFAFLDSEYRKHLTKLAIDDKILAYFPYDKLLIETFGDYPFFTELLPKGLFTAKIRLLVGTLWGDDPAFRGFSHLSEKKKTAVFQRTVENLFADPDRILRAAFTLPFWLIVPSVMLFALYKGFGGSLHYRMIQLVFYTACVILAFLSLTIGFFEPIQISRWLWREATYHRRKRWLKKEKGAVYRGLSSAADGVRAFLPSAVAVLFLFASAYYTSKERTEIIRLSLAVWPGEIDGFKPGRNYSGIMLRQGAKIMASDLSDAQFGEAMLAGVTFEKVTLDHASFNCANLSKAVFHASPASGADFGPCNADKSRPRGVTLLNGANFINTALSGAHFNNAGLLNAQFAATDLTGADFTHAYLLNAKFTGNSRLDNAEFGCAYLRGASFENSSAIKATFKCDLASPTRPISMFGVKFEDVDFTNADFSNVDLRGAEFSDSTVNSMLASGVIDEGTAKNLTRIGAQTNLPTKPLPGAGQCIDADCEYSRAMLQVSNFMPDLVESLILRGGRQNWEAAKAGLNETKTSPDFASNPQLEGRHAVLTLLLRLVSRQPDGGATHEWCTWISKNHTLTSWRWNIWDHEVPKLHLSPEVLAEVNAVEASAQGQPTKGLCVSDSK